MNMSNTYAPPINNACVPDIYNKLDAEVIERTRIANNQLSMRLLVEQKLIAKYKLEAERFRRKERSLVAKDLSRITQKLPAVINIQDFDEKFFGRRSRSDPLPGQKKKKRSYLEAKNENAICHRCYIHHLPSKKRFYRRETPPPAPSIFEYKSSNGHHDSKTKTDNGSNSTASLTQHADQNGSVSATDPSEYDELEALQSDSHAKSQSSRLIPPADKFKFLERDGYGRERDLNESLTPRLMPNEVWKTVVKNVCNQCSKELQKVSATALKNRRLSRSHTREKTFERLRGNKIRRPSIANANKSFSNVHPLPNIGAMNHSPQGNLHKRRTSFAAEDNPAGQPEAPSRLPSKLSRSNSRSNSFRRPSLLVADGPSRSHSIVKQHTDANPKLAGTSKREQKTGLKNDLSSTHGKQTPDSHKMTSSLENSRSSSSLMRQKT